MSGKRKELLVNHEFYHVYNRSVANEQIFKNLKSLKRAIELIKYYSYPQKLRYSRFNLLPFEQKKDYESWYKNQERIVEIHAFAFMPNHFHLSIEQLKEGGIIKLLSNFQNSYGKYYNTISRRYGSIFQKPFKAKRIPSDDEFLHIGRYIHLNPVTSFNMEISDLEKYPYDSYFYYLNEKENSFIKRDLTLNLVGSLKKYKRFVENRVDYQRKLKQIQYLLFG